MAGWAAKAGMTLPLVDKRLDGKKLRDTSLTHAMIPAPIRDESLMIKRSTVYLLY